MEQCGGLFDNDKARHRVVISIKLVLLSRSPPWGPFVVWDCAPPYRKSAENPKGAFKLVIPSAAIDYLPSGDGGRS
jgi:hypothetical protein